MGVHPVQQGVERRLGGELDQAGMDPERGEHPFGLLHPPRLPDRVQPKPEAPRRRGGPDDRLNRSRDGLTGGSQGHEDVTLAP